MSQGLKSFFTKIQNSNEGVKKRYLFVFSIIAMVVIVGLWVLYMKSVSAPKVENKRSISIQKTFSVIFQWSKDLIFKIKEGRVINIER